MTKRQIAGVFQEIKAHSAYNRRAGRLIEALGTCFRRRGAGSGVESFGESISLVIHPFSFDVKGAFNGVHSKLLEHRLAARRVPKPMVEWIGNFCTGRHASVTVGRFESEVAEI